MLRHILTDIRITQKAKAPDNLKTRHYNGSTWEKDQGCKMITGLKKEYPKASKSVYKSPI